MFSWRDGIHEMAAARPITIVGGGLAGLTLGIGLRQRGVAVTVWEAGRYPRHRVCGEFISGKGQAALGRLGLTDLVMRAGTIPARTAAFFSERAESPVLELAEPAWSISRYALDNTLAKEFRRLGGDLRENERWRESEPTEGVVRASGRKPAATANGWRWFGMKIHARNVRLTADLEMHLAPDGYMGISHLANGEVNICGLFRRPAAGEGSGGMESPKEWRKIFLGAEHSARHARLADAEFDEGSLCTIGGLSLEARRAAASGECCIGDAITMIPPVTGNGMSMAFESAELALEPLAAYSGGELAWAEAQRRIAVCCDQTFARRLAWAGRLQNLMFKPAWQDALVRFAPRWHWLWRFLVARTR